MNKLTKRTVRFLWISMAVILILCVAVFAFITTYMVRESDRAIGEIGEIYMEEMNRQMEMHFSSIIDLRLTQVEAIVWGTPPEEVSAYGEEMLDALAAAAMARGFTYLALCSTEGDFDVIYGPDIEVVDLDGFLASLNQAERKVAVGIAEDEKVLLLGVSVGYPLSEGYPLRDGSQCTALVAGLPIEYINATMSLAADESLAFSHIIRKDGSFVVENSDYPSDNYYELLEIRAEFEGQTVDEAVEQMRAALNEGEAYTLMYSVDGERRHAYCSPLPHSEWYLITIMPRGLLDETVIGLGTRRIYTALAGCGAILLALLTVFFLYFRMSRKQMRAVENAQREAERASRAKSEFLSNMSHDIRTPMNAIMGMTAIATANIDNPDQVRECLRKITLSSKHLLGLINDVLDMSKIESGRLSLNLDVLSLREAMESIVSIAQPQVRIKRQSFDVYIHDIRAERVYCDGVRLNQVLLNLLSNALKFTPEGGSVSVSLAQEASPRGDAYVRTHFWVRDNGIGMSKAFQKRIFDSFEREDNARVHKIEGTGLGMAIVKYIVDEMGGTIEVESEIDKGSEFHVCVDFEIAVQREEDMLLPDWEMLVVDDDEQLCLSAVASLREIGVRADWAQSGERAVEMAAQRHQAGRDYHVVLLDWQMPGLNGIETARRLRERVGDAVPIVLISAYDWSDIELEARAAGVNGFIPKPLFKSTLFHGLSRFAGSEAASAQEGGEEAANFEGRRLLLAEDNDLNWEIACELLSTLGFTMERAENGRLCVERFEASAPGDFDAILMDIRMPVMNGYDAARAIRASGRPDSDIPIIAMTADAFSEDIQRAVQSGMTAHVAKPIDLRELVRVLQKYLR